MAKCLICASLCVYLLILCRIEKVSSNNDIYLYQTHNLQPEVWQLSLQDADHQLAKRDVLINTTTEMPTAPKFKNVKIHKSMLPVNMTKLTMKDSYNKNLGVNGTGQRRNVSSSTVPISVVPVATIPQPAMPPLVHNISVPTTETEMETNLNSTTNTTDEDNDDDFFKDVDVVDKVLNSTLAKHNLTASRTDSHYYYNSTMKTDETTGLHYWIDMTNRSDVKINDLLSGSHRRAATIKLSFDFPFYGHIIKNVTIATGGFLYTGDYVHSWLAATQYIAPLMANFDTSLSNNSYIKYLDNGTAFTVLWERVMLQDKPKDGEFTFQVTLHSNGDIVFVYQNVPLIIENIQDDFHPVKVGLSDAYIMDRTIFFVRRKTIYEYHRVNFPKEDIKNWTVIYLNALPTCLGSKDCSSCTTQKVTGFECAWCSSTNKCSNGFDRHRQDWISKNCDKKKITNETMCSHITGSDIFDENDSSYNHDSTVFEHLEDQSKSKASRIYDNNSQHGNALGPEQPVRMGVSGIVAILFLIGMVSGLGFWILYAYRNPHTTSGQILIRYRPTQWRWRRGEARYTAATIHM